MTSDTIQILGKHFGDDPHRRSEIEQIKQNMEIGSFLGLSAQVNFVKQRVPEHV